MTCLCGDCHKCGYSSYSRAELERDNARLRAELTKPESVRKAEAKAKRERAREDERRLIQTQINQLQARLKELEK